MINIKNHKKSPEIDQKLLESPTRCLICNKKIGLVGFQCKCNNYYCIQHRYADRHDCKFDYKEFNKKLLEKSILLIIPSKVDPI